MEKNVIEKLCLLPKAESLQQLCDLTCEIVGNPAFVSDLAHTILAYTKSVKIDDPVWQANIVESHLDRNTLTQDREVSTVHAASGESAKPVLVEDGFMPYPRIIKTLVSRGSAIGVLVVTSYRKPFEPGDIELVDLISSFVVQRMAEEMQYPSDAARSVEGFFIKLLGGARFPEERVRKRLDILEYRRHPFTYVLSVHAAPGSAAPESAELEQLIGRFRRLSGCVAFPYNAAIVCVYGSETDITNWAEQAPELTELLAGEDLIAGASRQMTDFSGLMANYVQAQRTEEIGMRLGRPERIFSYDSLASFAMLQNIPRETLDDYCHQRIRHLGAYDNEHGTELCATLQVYLEQAKSLARTSEILFVHRNTVRYRILKCMELMNTDLEDGNEIFAYIFSLRILEYQKKFPSE
jgi:hypothetical protein